MKVVPRSTRLSRFGVFNRALPSACRPSARWSSACRWRMFGLRAEPACEGTQSTHTNARIVAKRGIVCFILTCWYFCLPKAGPFFPAESDLLLILGLFLSLLRRCAGFGSVVVGRAVAPEGFGERRIPGVPPG